MEVENAIRQRTFHQRRVLPSNERATIKRERDAALGRLKKWVKSTGLKELTLDMDSAMDRGRQLSALHSGKTGARAVDVLHVACALLLESEVFLTSDQRQAALAKAEGMQVLFVPATELA